MALSCLTFNEKWVRWMIRADDFRQLPSAWRTEEVIGRLKRHAAHMYAGLRLDSLDRTGKVQPLLPMQLLDPLPADLGGFSKTFAQCCLERAEALVATGKPLDVYYSGGIDSTVIVAALHAVGAPLAQILIHMTWNSVLENPVFYRNVIKRYPHTITTHADVSQTFDLANPDRLLVSGNLAGPLFPPPAYTQAEADRLDAPYCEGLSLKFTQATQAYLEGAPLPIRTTRAYLHYLDLNARWQRSALVFHCIRRRGALGPNWRDWTFSFFGTADFQRWAMVGQTPEDWPVGQDKWPAKLFIHEIAPDDAYLHGKRKVVSYQTVGNASWRLLLADGRLLHQDDLDAHHSVE